MLLAVCDGITMQIYRHAWSTYANSQRLRSVNTTNTYSPAGLVVVQVHKAATLFPGPSTVVLLPLSDVNKSLSESATHIVRISLYISSPKLEDTSAVFQYKMLCITETRSARDGKHYTIRIHFQVFTAIFDYLMAFFWVSAPYDTCVFRRFGGG